MWATAAIAKKPYIDFTTIPCTNHSSLVNSDFHCAGTKSLFGLSAIVVTPFQRVSCRIYIQQLVCPACSRAHHSHVLVAVFGDDVKSLVRTCHKYSHSVRPKSTWKCYAYATHVLHNSFGFSLRICCIWNVWKVYINGIVLRSMHYDVGEFRMNIQKNTSSVLHS